MDSPRRRALLGALGLTAVGLSAGCLQTSPSSETDTRPTAGAKPSATTDSPETDSATSDSTERTRTESATAATSKRTDDLFLENQLADDRPLDVRVTRRTEGGGELLLYRRYEVPAGSWLELPNLVVVGDTYTVEARLPGGEWQEFGWAVLDCSEYGTPTQEPRTPEDDPTLNTDSMVRIRDDGLEFLHNECDAIAFSRDRAPPASEHVVRDYLATTQA